MFKGKHQYTRKNKVKEKDKIYTLSLESPGKFCLGKVPLFVSVYIQFTKTGT
jgi:hypothetical protein